MSGKLSKQLKMLSLQNQQLLYKLVCQLWTLRSQGKVQVRQVRKRMRLQIHTHLTISKTHRCQEVGNQISQRQ